jgi:hypothetical protein
MNRSRTLAVSTLALAVLALAPLRLAAANTAAGHARIAMMEHDKMKKPDQPAASGMNMPPSGGQSQPMSGGMGDDKMKMPQAAPMQMPGGQDGMMQMMQMMEKMMRSHMQSSSGAAGASGPADVTERLEGRIAFLKTELQISDKQLADWNSLADALRSGRQHLLEARNLLVMDDKMAGLDRLEHYERHLSERLAAIKSARAAFTRLYASLSEAQKQTADAILLPLIATF